MFGRRHAEPVAASVAPTTAARPPPHPPPGLQAAGTCPTTPAASIKVGYLPKDIVNQYFAAAKTGVDKAAGELGGNVTQVGPPSPKAASRSRSSPT